jgi:hypothetical protein
VTQNTGDFSTCCNKNAIKNTEKLEKYIYCIPIKKNKSVLISNNKNVV